MKTYSTVWKLYGLMKQKFNLALVYPDGQGTIKAYEDCRLCPPGSYNDGSVTKEAQTCILCPEGSTTSETGATDFSSCTDILNK